MLIWVKGENLPGLVSHNAKVTVAGHRAIHLLRFTKVSRSLRAAGPIARLPGASVPGLMGCQ